MNIYFWIKNVNEKTISTGKVLTKSPFEIIDMLAESMRTGGATVLVIEDIEFSRRVWEDAWELFLVAPKGQCAAAFGTDALDWSVIATYSEDEFSYEDIVAVANKLEGKEVNRLALTNEEMEDFYAEDLKSA